MKNSRLRGARERAARRDNRSCLGAHFNHQGAEPAEPNEHARRMQTGSGHSGNGVGKQRKSCRQGWAPGRGGGWKLSGPGFAKTFFLNQAFSPQSPEIHVIRRVPSKRAKPRPAAPTTSAPTPTHVRVAAATICSPARRAHGARHRRRRAVGRKTARCRSHRR